MRHRILCLFCLVLAVSQVVEAQVNTGTIQGLVTDQSGAVIPGVEISVKSLNTNQVRNALTNETGNYLVPLLPSGPYEVKAELSGFRTDIRSGLELRVEQRLNLNFQLEVGTITDTLIVTAASPLVQSDTSTVGSTIDVHKMVELPLDGRRYSSVAMLLPTATRIRAEDQDGQQQRDHFSLAGLPARYNNYMLDGITNQDNVVQVAVKPSMDSVVELKVLSGTYSAEYGRGGGAQVNVVTKSGTNAIHGSIYELYRNAKLDARKYFDKLDNPNGKLPPFYRHQFGFSLGGPIVRDKTFFFIADEGLRLSRSTSRATQVPLPEMKRGDFSVLLQADNIFGRTVQLRDPFNNNAPFPGNIIPADRFDPSGLAVANVYPNPNQAGKFNFLSSTNEDWRWHTPSVRIDHKFSEKDSMFFRANHNLLRTDQPYRASDIPGYKGTNRLNGSNLALSETHMFSSALINEFRIGYFYFFDRYPTEQLGFDVAEKTFGIHGTSRDPKGLGSPRFNITGFPSFSDSDQPRIDNTYQIYDNISWITGNHALKFGGDSRSIQNALYAESNPQGTFTFNGGFSGYSLADVLLGIPVQVSIGRGVSSVYVRSKGMSLFVQDDWKYSKNLTFNLGVRYEVMQAPYEKDNHNSSFNPQTGKVDLAGVDGVPRGLYPTDWNKFAPRLGFAYNLTSDGSTIVRGGYGVYFNQESRAANISRARGSYPWSVSLLYASSTTRPDITLRDPFPSSLGTAVISYFAVDSQTRMGYVQQFSFGLQREIGRNQVVELSYLGNKSTKQEISRQINQPTPGPGDRNAVNARRPFPALPNISQVQNSANMNYNSLVVRTERRFSGGLTYNAAYTWGKTIHDQTTPDMRDTRLGRGPADIDTRHILSSSVAYQLPFGRGTGPASALARGWQVVGILQLRSGQAFTPTLSADISNTTTLSDRPNLIGDPRSSDPGPRTGWWNAAAFVRPEPFTFGNAGTGILRGPDLRNLDVAIQRVMKVTESKNLEFRAEFFNVTNRVNFASPNTQFDSPLFGTIVNTLEPRDIQLGLKFIF